MELYDYSPCYGVCRDKITCTFFGLHRNMLHGRFLFSFLHIYDTSAYMSVMELLPGRQIYSRGIPHSLTSRY